MCQLCDIEIQNDPNAYRSMRVRTYARITLAVHRLPRSERHAAICRSMRLPIFQALPFGGQVIRKLLAWLFPPRKPGPRAFSPYKYQCMSCGGRLSDERVRAGKDCYWCESREGTP